MSKTSWLEEALALQMKALKIEFEREYKFHPERRWRFDFAIPHLSLAIEAEGGTWSGGRHNSGSGYQKDCEKYSEAAVLGWRVIRVTGDMINTGQAIKWIERAVKTN